MQIILLNFREEIRIEVGAVSGKYLVLPVPRVFAQSSIVKFVLHYREKESSLCSTFLAVPVY